MNPVFHSMSGMTGIMSQMPPLPMNINDNLMSILHCPAHVSIYYYLFHSTLFGLSLILLVRYK